MSGIALLPDQWTTLIDAIRRGAVRRLRCSSVDLCALDEDTFLAAIGSGGLQSLVILESVFPSGFVTDALLRASGAKGVLELAFVQNKSDTPHILSDEAVLDFCFAVHAAPGEKSRCLELEGSGITQMFLKKFFEVGTLIVHGVPYLRRPKLSSDSNWSTFSDSYQAPSDPLEA